MKLPKVSRRKLLTAMGLLAAVPVGLKVSEALAWPRRGSSGHNGGRSQVNFNFLQGGGDYPFIDKMKEAQDWGWGDNSTVVPLTPDLFDDNRYWATAGVTLPRGGLYTGNIFIPTPEDYPGGYYLEWDGLGTLTVGCSGGTTTAVTPVSGSLSNLGGGVGQYRFTLPAGSNRIHVGHTVNGTPRVTAIRLMHEFDRPAYLLGQQFTPKFKLRLLSEAKFGYLRFLNWQAANVTNVTKWENANRPVAYMSYQASQYRTDYLCNAAGSGIMTNSGSDYAVSAPSNWATSGGKPADKTIIHAVFNRNSATMSDLVFAGGGSPNITWQNTFVGSISNGSGGAGTLLVVQSVTRRIFCIGQEISGPGVTPGTVITGFLGTARGGSTPSAASTGVQPAAAFLNAYTVSNSQLVAVDTTLTAGHGIATGNKVAFQNNNLAGSTSTLANASSITASVSTSIMTLGSVIGGTGFSVFRVGMTVSGTGITPGTTILNQLTGPAGGAGTYTLSTSVGAPTGTITVTGQGLPYGVVASVAIPGTLYNATVVDGFTITVNTGGSAINFPTIDPIVAPYLSAFIVPTLNVAGTGNIRIYSEFCSWISTGGNAYPAGGWSGSQATLVYDAMLDAWSKQGGTLGSGGIQNAVPISVCLDVCIEMRAHPHFCAPAMALTPASDWTYECASYIRSRQPAWMKPRYEGPNELWNTANAGFLQTPYANAVATMYGWGADYISWYGKAMSLLGQDVARAYGITAANRADVKTQTEYDVICAMQSAINTTPAAAISSNGPRLTSVKYLANTGGLQLPTQAGYELSAAQYWTTYVCPANYNTTNYYGRNNEVRYAFDYYVTYRGNPTAQAAVLAAYVEGLTFGFQVNLPISSPGQVSRTDGLPHGLAVGDIGNTVTNGTFPGGNGLGVGTYWVATVPSATVFTLSSTDPNNGGITPVNFTGAAATGNHYWTPWGGIGNVTVAAVARNTKNLGTTYGVDKQCYYEGGWSPDYSTNAVTSALASPGATQDAAGCVVTLPTTSVQNIRSPAAQQNATNPAAVVGMALGFASVGGMTQLNTTATTCSFVNGSADITSAGNILIVGQGVVFTTNSILPVSLIAGYPYWVVSAGNPFQVSETKGGSPIVINTAEMGVGAGVTHTANGAWRVKAVSGVSVTLDVDSSAFGAWTSGGTATYIGLGTCPGSGTSITNRYFQEMNNSGMLDVLRRGGKDAPLLKDYNLALYAALSAPAIAGGDSPSMYLMGGGGYAWSVLDTNIYSGGNPPQWQAAVEFNA